MKSILQSSLLALLIATGAVAGTYQHVGVGGGGMLHSGAAHPSDPSYVVVGADVSGAYLSTDAGASWVPDNEGLKNPDELTTNYVSDVIGVSHGNEDFFVATTYGGIYRQDLGGQSWNAMTPYDDYWYGHKYTWGIQPMAIPFECIDWDGEALLVAGAGRARWQGAPNWESKYFPASAVIAEKPSCVPDSQSIWICDLDAATPSWTAMPNTHFGAVRDVSVMREGETIKIAAVTPSGIWFWQGTDWMTGSSWTNLGNLLTFAVRPDKTVAWKYMEYGTTMDGWSVHLTERGSLYVACSRNASETTLPSGVYRIHDASPYSMNAWFYVGDTTQDPYFKATMFTMGLEGSYHPENQGYRISPGEFIFMSVADGAGQNGEDVIYLGDNHNSGMYGLFRGECPYSDSLNIGIWKNLIANRTWLGATTLTNAEDGWIWTWGANVDFHPAIVSTDGDVVFAALNGRLHKSSDGGDSWTMCYTSGDESGWSTKGYSELGVFDLDWFGDSLVEATADAGLFLSTDANMTALTDLTPPYHSGYPGTEDGQIWERSCKAVEVADNWNGSGRQALFAIFGSYEPYSKANKIMMYHDATGTGPEWTWVDIPTPERYVFHDLALVGDNKVYAPYIKFDEPADGDSPIEARGVMLFEFDGSSWSATPYDAGLDTAIFKKIAYSESSGRLFLSAIVPGGGIWYRQEDTSASSWVKCVGPGDDAVPSGQTTWGDVRCIAGSGNGAVVYAGTRGRSADGYGTVLKCSDPSATPPVFVPQFNMDVDSCALEYEVPRHQASIYGWDVLDANHILTHVSAIQVNPYDADEYWFGVSSDNGFLADKCGVWKGRGSAFVRTNSGELFDGIPIMSLNLAVDGRIVVGTCGLETWVSSRVEAHVSRVTDGLIALYDFNEGHGDSVYDKSNVLSALNLAISDSTAIEWIPGGGLTINSSVIIGGSGTASKITAACQADTALTVEAWVKPANVSQEGPARIVALSRNGYPNGGNFILGQEFDGIEARVRTDLTDVYGRPFLTQTACLDTALTHILYTRDANGAKALYLNGELVGEGNTGGTFGNWGDYSFTIGNEPDGLRTWLGSLYLVAVYDRALSEPEVARNFLDGQQVLGHAVAKRSISANQIEAEMNAQPARSLLLRQNSPNPFNPSTQITIVFPNTTHGTVSVYDARGRLVRRLFSGVMQSGTRDFEWDGRNDVGARVASGLYFVRLVTDEETLTKKMMMTK